MREEENQYLHKKRITGVRTGCMGMGKRNERLITERPALMSLMGWVNVTSCSLLGPFSEMLGGR